MTPDVAVKRGDRKPSIQVNLVDAAGEGIVLPAGTSTARFSMRHQDTGHLVTGSAIVLSLGTVGPPNVPAVLRYDFAQGDLARVGLYDAEFEVTLPSGGGTESFPNHRNLLVAVRQDVA